MPITREQIRQYELLLACCAESLMRPIDQIENNNQGYAYFTKDQVRATLSTNPHARWAVGAYGLTRAEPDEVAETIAFFRGHQVSPMVRIVPDGFTKERAALLTGYGLRHTGFHAVFYAPLPTTVERAPAHIRVVHVTDPAEYGIALDVQLEGWGMPPNPDSPLKKLRRCWQGLSNHRTYLAYLDGQPAGHAMMYLNDGIAYLENASTIPRFRRQGVQSALIRQRITDATELKCRTILSAADYESNSRNNQMRAGLQLAYLAALWTE